MKIDLCLIVAVTENGVIGLDGGMPWKLSTDLQRFKAITIGKPIIMGRKTWDSLGRPLPKRQNIVITRDKNFKQEGAIIVHSFEEAKKVAEEEAIKSGQNEIFIIGGGEIFQKALPLVDKLYFTEILDTIAGDTYFPKFSIENWRIVETQLVPKGEKDSHTTRFTVFERIL